MSIFSKLLGRKQFYICDPNKNTKCSKEGCWFIDKKGPCKCTAKKKYAKTHEHSEPIIATDSDLINTEWMEMNLEKITLPDNFIKNLNNDE